MIAGTTEHAVEDPLDGVLARARTGDEAAFHTLWTALQPRLLRYLRIKARDVAEDVAAETWLQVVRDLDRFAGDAADFRAWLFTIGRNRAVDAARARAARPVHLVAEPIESPTAHADSAEAVAMERLSTAAALAMVRSLPADQAELVALRVVAGLEVAAVARIVGKSPGAVRVAVHRALRALSKLATTSDVDELSVKVM
jgi:RNA polymerase sigma-70 factor (ECF subfamily)